VGYVPKSYDMQQMANALGKIHDGEIYLPAALMPADTTADEAEIRRRCERIGIADKTYQILVCAAKGKTNKEIAEELNVSVHTVKAHLARLFEKLQTSNRMDTVMEAIRLGLIDG
jgi:DNA-binding NarL/FixJ family response regulator